ncbi:MAG: phosphoribosylamine--glycine ligase [Bacillota bacterium]|nr:phosphoribosylamine--glycine ligase [Bacillota bacterium]
MRARRQEGRRILILGSGAREHALAWWLLRDPGAPAVAVLPGNDGLRAAGVATLPGSAEEPAQVVAAARDWQAELVVVGPEAPLAAGVADALAAAGIPCLGPVRAAARIESSKLWARLFMARHGIPGPAFATAASPEEVARWTGSRRPPYVLKADGLAAGKGVFLAATRQEALEQARRLLAGALGEAGRRLVLEEYLEGRELSVFALADGRRHLLLGAARDHKRLLEGDRGPNTGGMGACAPVPGVDEPLLERIERRILAPALEGLAEEGAPFRGFLYAGLMLTREGPQVLEFNARLGDPEAQALLPLLAGDGARPDRLPGGFPGGFAGWSELLLAAARGELPEHLPPAGPPRGRPDRWALATVLAAPGYPEAPRHDLPIRGLERLSPAGAPETLGPALPESLLFHAATRRAAGGTWRTAGGRLLTAVGLGSTPEAARARSQALLAALGLEGGLWRRDIGLVEPAGPGRPAGPEGAPRPQ